jgi:ATP-dependent exoDNAse (exonuclease V) beta subunit
VVLGSLDRGERRHAFDVAPETERESFDPRDPLGGRWIRYWPWPLGNVTKAPLRDAAAQSPAGKRVAAREKQERVRLLYVGFTRARDHLVLAVRTEKGKVKCKWIDALVGRNGEPLLVLPPLGASGRAECRVAGRDEDLEVEARVRPVSGDAVDDAPRERVGARWFARPSKADVVARAPYWITPSREIEGWPELEQAVTRASVGRVERLPRALVAEGRGYDYAKLGNAVHAFMAADWVPREVEARVAMAQRLLDAESLLAVVRPESLVEASDQFRKWVKRMWPRARWRAEVPVEARVACVTGERRLAGVIDLVLETEGGLVIVDHKTFPGSAESAWRAKCIGFAPQLIAYAEAIGKGEDGVREMWIHLPCGAGLVEIRNGRT